MVAARTTQRPMSLLPLVLIISLCLAFALAVFCVREHARRPLGSAARPRPTDLDHATAD